MENPSLLMEEVRGKKKEDVSSSTTTAGDNDDARVVQVDSTFRQGTPQSTRTTSHASLRMFFF